PGLAAPPDFDRAVLPILAGRCLECHSGDDPKAGLDLSRQQATRAVLVPGRPDASALWQRVRTLEMPPKKPLPDAEQAVLRSWIEAGAKWGTDPIDRFAITTTTRAGRDWWSLQPIARPSAPGSGNPIDAFVRKRLAEAHVEPAPLADRRTLIRRVY